MMKIRNMVFLIVAMLFLIPLASTHAAEEELTIASVLPLTGQFGPAGLLDAAGQKDCVVIINEEGGNQWQEARVFG